MKTNKTILFKVIGRKLAVILLITGSAIAGFATLGDGKAPKSNPGKSKSLLTNKTQATSFSLRSGYSFRGNEVINTNSNKYINLNTVITYQKGNTTYILPLKKKVVMANVKIDISNRQLRRF